ncbi:MAG: Integrins alpha chain [Deltaproteobacteria bacterium]|nr:Integrins alpha chain [Deltaproteobacteria bacterium]
MKLFWSRVTLFLTATTVVTGCQGLRQESTLSAKQSTGAAPVRYSPARDGLPTARIWKSQIAFGDINGDGFADIGAVSRLADGPWIWKGDGKGHWTDASAGLPRESFCGGGMKFGDVNRDGKMDVAIADHCRGVFVFLGDGDGHWTNASGGLPTTGSEDVALGDFNHDGCLDVVAVAAGEEGIRAYEGNCKGVWKEHSTGLPQSEWGNALKAADVDGDGNVDIIAAYSAGPRVYLGDGKGNWREASEGLPAPEIHGLYWGVDVGDVNGDGKLDIVSGAAIPGVEVFIQEPGPKWRKAVEGIVPMNALGVAFGDLNNDGKLDLVAVGKTNLEEIGGVYGVFPFLGDGTGNWKLVGNTGLPTTGKERTWGVGLADIDKDGVLDIGVAFGDVLSPTWRSGAAKPGETEKDKAQAAAEQKMRGPERGMFGSIEVWRGQLVGK